MLISRARAHFEARQFVIRSSGLDSEVSRQRVAGRVSGSAQFAQLTVARRCRGPGRLDSPWLDADDDMVAALARRARSRPRLRSGPGRSAELHQIEIVTNSDRSNSIKSGLIRVESGDLGHIWPPGHGDCGPSYPKSAKVGPSEIF